MNFQVGKTYKIEGFDGVFCDQCKHVRHVIVDIDYDKNYDVMCHVFEQKLGRTLELCIDPSTIKRCPECIDREQACISNSNGMEK